MATSNDSCLMILVTANFRGKKINFLSHILIFTLDLFSESGEMCAMKEVTLFSDDAKSKESAKQLMQVSSCCFRFHIDSLIKWLMLFSSLTFLF